MKFVTIKIQYQRYYKDQGKLSKTFHRNIEEVYKVLNNMKKKKPKLNITTKYFLRKQIIIQISSNNSEKIMAMLSKYIANINRALKDIKSDIMADFLWKDNKGLVITTNKVTAMLDLNAIENYIKNIDVVNSSDIMSSRLP